MYFAGVRLKGKQREFVCIRIWSARPISDMYVDALAKRPTGDAPVFVLITRRDATDPDKMTKNIALYQFMHC